MHIALVTLLAVVFSGCASVTGGLRSAVEPTREPTQDAVVATATDAAALDEPVLAATDYKLAREDDSPSTPALLLAQTSSTSAAAPSDAMAEDFGQTLGFYGVSTGPFLILPFLEPLTVRDGIGKAVDGAMDPMSYFVPFFWTRLLLKVEETVNDRSLNLELFQGFEESVIDMYSAVRHGYLKRREKMIKE